jgi:hypothetical protein
MAHDETHASVPPYGQAISDAAARGDLAEMEEIADAARIVLAKSGHHEGVQFEHSASEAHQHFAKVAPQDIGKVREALTELEKKIVELRAAGGQQQQRPEPEQSGGYDTPR